MPVLSKTLLLASLVLSVLAHGGGHAPRHHSDVAARYAAPGVAADVLMAPHARRMRKVRRDRGPGGPGGEPDMGGPGGPDSSSDADATSSVGAEVSATGTTTTATAAAASSTTATTATTSFLSGTQTGEGELNCSCPVENYCSNTMGRHILRNGSRRLRYHKHRHRLHHCGFAHPIRRLSVSHTCIVLIRR